MYNLDVVTFIARNRLTNWANGARHYEQPAGENLKEDLVEILLCRHAEDVGFCSNTALDMLKLTPEPKLFPKDLLGSYEGRRENEGKRTGEKQNPHLS